MINLEKFLKENKIAVAIILAGMIIGGAIYVSYKKEDQLHEVFETKRNTSICQIHFTQAPKYVGQFCEVEGMIDHIYISKKGNVFLNFCKDYKTCPFTGVIFKEDAPRFELSQYEGKKVKIKGLIKTYKGRPEIIINDSEQIKIE
jgi:hypothetical protein